MHPSTSSSQRLESAAFYVLLVTVVLAPLAFWPSTYVALDTVKTIVIALGTIISAVLYGLVAFREKSLTLPPRSMIWMGILIAASLVASALASGHFLKSFFGQGFESGAGSFVLVLFISAVVAFAAVYRRAERAVVIYAGLVASFLVLWIIHAIRLIPSLGTGFLSLGILGTLTTTIFGNWYSLAAFAITILILSLVAIAILPLSRRMKIAYWILAVLSLIAAVVINSVAVWEAAVPAFLGLAIYLSAIRPRHQHSDGMMMSWVKRIAWVPVIALAIAVLFAWKGSAIAGPSINKLNASYSELSLPWQMTLDVATGALKDQPLLGVGPNRFTQAFLAHKPAGINTTDAWGVEFANGFGLIPTYAVTQGLVGLILWILLFIYIGVLGRRSLSKAAASTDPSERFVIISSFTASVFLWILALVYVPSEALLFITFLMTGIWLGASAAYKAVVPWHFAPMGARASRAFSPIVVLMVVLAILWGVIFVKNTTALAYFASGLKQLTSANDPAHADADFRAAVDLNPADVYWQARAEAALAEARALVATLKPGMDASSTQAVAAQTIALGNQALIDSQNAIKADPTNYYNYYSEARVAEFAVSLQMQSGYGLGVQAYQNAIQLNPGNPSLYLSLARLQASANQLDPALQTVGAALQVKNNYLDAVFLLSQIEAAKGNLPDAITAAQFAIGLNNTNPLLYFQLGLLQYTNGDYADAATTLAQAVKFQGDYANAQYFLGLSYARLGQFQAAAAQFQQLAVSNPNNQEVALILANLEAGKSPFAGAPASESTAPEKRPNPPIPEKQAR